jgi:prepilin-type N-terminal cleavage/methylation domain-containing protein
VSTSGRGPARGRESGFSIPELIVAMAILSIVMTLVVTLFVSFTTNFTRERAVADSTSTAAIGMNQVTKVVRAGTTLTKPDRPVFVKADREELILHSYLADDAFAPEPVMIRLGIDSNRQLIEQRWSATTVAGAWDFPNLVLTPAPSRIATTPESSRVIARKIIAPTATEVSAGAHYLFTYLRADGTTITAPVAASELGNIATVKVTMTVQADQTGRADPVTIQNQVGMPNLTASRLGIEG